MVSVASNLIPSAMAELCRAILENRISDAEAIEARYNDLFEAFLKLDTNPVPIKAALGLTHECSPQLRLPMVEMSDEKVEKLRYTLARLDLL